MRWAITWDGTRLVVVQRAARMAWFGVAATTVMALGWYPLIRPAGGVWRAVVGTVLFAAVDVGLVAFNVWARRRVEASYQLVCVGKWSVPAARVRILTIRWETSWMSTRWGRGHMTVGKLFVGLVDGRTVDLVTIDGDVLDGRAGRRLAAGLAALPYGRPPRASRGAAPRH
jgi:hypothetical protein